jgi:transposase, IS30 family
MRDWRQIAVASGIQVYFCDPHAPWQRGTNENTNGLLRQYFPKGFDFTTVTEADLDNVADELNDRPRKRLDFYKPSERIAELCGLQPGQPRGAA